MTNQIPEKIWNVLNELKVTNPTLLGKGGEGFIFTYSKDTVIKIYINFFNDANENYLQSLTKLQSFISSKNLPFATPQILQLGKVNSTYYTIEKRLYGDLMEHKFPNITEKEQYKLLKSYYDAIKALNDIELPDLPYGNILQIPPYRITYSTWPGFLIKMLNYKLLVGGDRLASDVIDLNKKAQIFIEIVKKELVINKKSLVHADYFVNQVLVDEKNEISAVLDISYHAVVGDRRLDAAGIFFFEGDRHYTQEHSKFLLDLSLKDYGESILKTNDIYRMYYCFYFSDVFAFHPEWYKTLIDNLNNETIWNRLRNYL